jgi:hypothetical protein
VDALESRAGEGKIVRRPDKFSELVEALRDGDLLTVRLFCAQLFHFDAERNSRSCDQAGDKEHLVGTSQE